MIYCLTHPNILIGLLYQIKKIGSSQTIQVSLYYFEAALVRKFQPVCLVILPEGRED